MPLKRPAARKKTEGNSAKKQRSQLSLLMNSFEESGTVKVSNQAKKLQEEGHKINRSLCSGEPNYGPPAEVFQALNDVPCDVTLSRYTLVQGGTALRKAICKDLQERKGVTYEPDQICVSNGGKQAIFEVMMAVCDAGDEVLVPTPCWVSYHDIARLCRATPREFETKSSDGYLVRPKVLEKALRKCPKCRVLILCNPGNPTGAVQGPKELEEIAAVLRKPEFAHILILADEIYERITYDIPHLCFASLPGMYERTLVINGFSKGHAMTGYRLGYLAASKEIVSACIKLQGQITSGASSVSQHAAMKALQHTPQIWVDERVKELREKRDFVLAKLKEMPGVHCEIPTGAFYAFPDLSGCLGKGASVSTGVDFCNILLERHKVALVPGEAFHSSKSVRISYAASMEDLESAMSAFAACVKEVAPPQLLQPVTASAAVKPPQDQAPSGVAGAGANNSKSKAGATRILGSGTVALRTSALGFGCMGITAFYGKPMPDDEAIRLMKHAFDEGVTHFDTAEAYTATSDEGHTIYNETVVGKAIQVMGRANVQIATKYMPKLHGGEMTTALVLEACQASCKRLQVDYVDLYYAHRFADKTSVEDQALAMKAVVDAGLARRIGVSEFSPENLRQFHAICPVTCVQQEWSLMNRDLEEDLVPTCRELGVGIVAYSPLSRALLTGELKSVSDLKTGDLRASRYPRLSAENIPKNAAIADRIRAHAEKRNVTSAQLALAWVSNQGEDVVPIPGTTRMKNLNDNIASCNLALDSYDLKEIASAVPLEQVTGDRYNGGQGVNTYKEQQT